MCADTNGGQKNVPYNWTICSCETPNTDAGPQTGVLWKSSKYCRCLTYSPALSQHLRIFLVDISAEFEMNT